MNNDAMHAPGTAPTIGAFPLYPPLELFDSLGLTPVVLWGMDRGRDQTPAADRRIQAYTCSVARRLVDLVLSERGASLAGLFSYNACDTLRNLPEIIADGLAESGRRVPHFKIHLPAHAIGDGYVGRYLYEEIDRLIGELEKTYGVHFSAPRFAASVEKYRAMRALALKMEDLAAAGALSFADVAAAVEVGGFKSVDAQIADYQRLIDGALETGKPTHRGTPGGPPISESAKEMGGFTGFRVSGPETCKPTHPGTDGWATPGIPVVLSGILAPPAPVLRALQEAGLRVAGNDLAALHRAHAYTPAAFAGPADYYVDFYGNHFPCPTLLSSADRRLDAVAGLVKSCGARGLIFIGEKFCEYEYFEYPALEARLRADGVQCLQIELALGDSAVNPTRFQAFAELLQKEVR